MTHASREIRRVVRLMEAGLNDCEISRRTGVPRTTVLTWRSGRTPQRERARSSCRTCGHVTHAFDDLPQSYVYLLGLYLGDGYVAAHAREVHRLSIYLDAQYPCIVEECRDSIKKVMPNNQVRVMSLQPASRMNEVVCYSKQWPCLLPQHGPGRKHDRPISLRRWQRRLFTRRPDLMLRGLIHSDGCRSINTIRRAERTYRYDRYIFTNRSGDIRSLFGEACDLLEIDWRQMNATSLSVARASSVARLDELVGPKR